MNSIFKVAALVLLTALIAGCRHKAKTIPPAAAQAPAVPVSQSAKNVPPPQMPPPELPNVAPSGAETAPPTAKPKPHKTAHRKPKPTTETPATDQAVKEQATAEEASNGAAGDISPIGQLSAGSESANVPTQSQILDAINATEKGLNDIHRPLSKEEQQTVAQIKTFLTKAKDALNQDDLDGANTLVTKAKVLLDELTK